MMLTTQDGIRIKLYAGLYLRTQRQTRFWGWGSGGWGRLRTNETERSWAGLAAWLRQAHARLDRIPALLQALPEAGTAPSPAQLLPQAGEQPRRRTRRKLQFVCNRRWIGLLIVEK
jgi:hypothetical protein